MAQQRPATPQPPNLVFRRAQDHDELVSCFAVISQLRPGIKNAADWVDHATGMAPDGYRVLAAWSGGQVMAVAGYRIAQNLIHGRFLYVDDLVTAESHRGQGIGSALLQELSQLGAAQYCGRLVLETASANVSAQRFYKNEGLVAASIGFVKPLEKAL